MPRCCSGASCACAIQAGAHAVITGTGSATDPFVFNADIGLSPASSTDFNVSMSGSGTDEDPWLLSVGYASTSKLDDVPDVNAPAPTNGQVLGWDSGSSRWTARAPTTAASGSVLTDTSLDGDGSSGTPLGVTFDPDGLLTTTVDGIGISEPGMNQMVLHYASDTVRASSTVTPSINAFSALDDTPGVTWYWTGTQWLPVTNGVARDYGTGEFMAMSGGYAAGVVTMMVRQVSVTTNADGTFDVLTDTDLAGAAGVLACTFQETGTVGFKTILNTNLTSVQGTAYRLDDGTVLGSQVISGITVAYIY
jgi:hypothetical protein